MAMSVNVKLLPVGRLVLLLTLLNVAFVLASAQPASDYRIRKGDKLNIKFLYQPELSEAALVVRPDGKISLPMIEELKAEGLTARELKTALEKAYREILLDPEITVNVVEFVAPRVFVTGQVVKPGSYDLRAGQTLFQIVSLAGGFTREAHRKQILHARPINERELKVVVVDVTKLLKPGNNKFDLQLQDGDYIYVPDSKMSKLSTILNAFRAVAPGYGIQL
jgi:polysaccharide export outer membrane protein